MATIHLEVHSPNTQAGQELLTCRVAELHADAVIRRLKALNCPPWQKQALLDVVIDTASQIVKAAAQDQS